MVNQLGWAVELAEKEQDLKRAHLLIALTQLRHGVDGRNLQLGVLIVLEYFEQNVNGEKVTEMLNE